ncbi:hypothetical protein L228DRAFT_263758 [Xylona heveae TC161]|uniref:tRNA(Phe) (4-demethylwyosine(37)-C(7)) aminocarboxypropyltransferase n=1 Tax=Xylona heveae (strain CBS 132557 / TC161) TaxID=1328760 RepID=A0A164ZRR3_XYLHT|nr:hypothetical protein L228DRAFT_263758 [Xylona heveae TC161]KZF19429.1 hypothetical protein L228DRAFT_263758 [Xylona heveae TC161]
MNVSIAVPKNLVKEIKDLLKQHGQLDRRRKIQEWDGKGRVFSLDGRKMMQDQDTSTSSSGNDSTPRLIIPTTIIMPLPEIDTESQIQAQSCPRDPKNTNPDAQTFIGEYLQNHLFTAPGPLAALSSQSARASIYVLLSLSESGTPCSSAAAASSQSSSTNILIAIVESWLQQLPKALLNSINVTLEQLRPGIPKTYTIYHPMLLLPAHAFRGEAWEKLLRALTSADIESRISKTDDDSPIESKNAPKENTNLLHALYHDIATALGVTHIATNGAIPLLSNQDNTVAAKTSHHTHSLPAKRCTSDQSFRSSHEDQSAPRERDNEHYYHAPDSGTNILRSPTALQPLYGDFGPVIPTPSAAEKESPGNHNRITRAELDTAFWVSTRQHGIYQTWAPRYTMFSRGNIREKARLRSVLAELERGVTISVAERGLCAVSVTSHNASIPDNSISRITIPSIPPSSCTAVDLYAGIGYFTFSYAAAGVSKVLCWELNPWSVEGLKRGSKENGWNAEVFDPNYSNINDDDAAEKAFTSSLSPTELSNKIAQSRISVFREDNALAGPKIDTFKRNLRAAHSSNSTSATSTDKPGSSHHTQHIDRLPPIRHVNLGLLPSSRDSWETAVRILDLDSQGSDCLSFNAASPNDDEHGVRVEYETLADCATDKCSDERITKRGYTQGLGGFLHVHENIATHDIARITDEIVREIGRIVATVDAEEAGAAPRPDAQPQAGPAPLELGAVGGTNTRERAIVCTHVERVKTYAPGVMHCVLDVYISPLLR